jgi:hypothetical protein
MDVLCGLAMVHTTIYSLMELNTDARQTNNCYCATAHLDWQTYNAGYILMEIEVPRLWCMLPEVVPRSLES